jgi:hypothetical protein
MAGLASAARWQEYRASKTVLFWSCAVCVVATMVVGFTWGGWVTGGTAGKLSESAASSARAELAATICVTRFMGGPDMAGQLAALKASNSWNRDDLLDKAGWSTPPGVEKPVRGAAELCAKQLLDVKAAAKTSG